MNTKLKIGIMAMLVLACSAAFAQPTLVGQSAQYGPTATLLNIQGTNATATATNVGLVTTNIGLTKYGDFDLQVTVSTTNAAAGTYDLTWQTSDDGINWVGASTPTGSATVAVPGGSGWFSVPLTNAGTTIYWRTNIALNSAGYFRIGWATNNAGQSMTNQVIKVYVKPRRYG